MVCRQTHALGDTSHRYKHCRESKRIQSFLSLMKWLWKTRFTASWKPHKMISSLSKRGLWVGGGRQEENPERGASEVPHSRAKKVGGVSGGFRQGVQSTSSPPIPRSLPGPQLKPTAVASTMMCVPHPLCTEGHRMKSQQRRPQRAFLCRGTGMKRRRHLFLGLSPFEERALLALQWGRNRDRW